MTPLEITQLQDLELAHLNFAPAIPQDLPSPFELSIPSSVLPQQLPSLPHKECAGTEFVILILIHYESWTNRSEDGESMQLNSVKKDLRRLLDHLKYRHDETNRAWYILTDFECIYKDYTGAEQPVTRGGLPDRESIVRLRISDLVVHTLTPRPPLPQLTIIEQVAKKGGSGLIHYGGHCYYAAPGTSKLEKQGAFTVFSEKQDYQLGREAAYLVCSDGQRIYGKDLFERLPDLSNTEKASTVILVLDVGSLRLLLQSRFRLTSLQTCSAAGLTADFPNLPYKYDPEHIPTVEPPPTLHTKPLNQLIVVTSSQLHESAVTINGCGALTFFMIEYLQKCPNASAIDLIQHLDAQCATQPNHRLRQHPQIQSRYPLNGPFRLNNSPEPRPQSKTSSGFTFMSDDIARKVKPIYLFVVDVLRSILGKLLRK
ncbi:hypothetical protein FRC04_006433 [Tulasnella sp. 424]|nr:hypothetical protein FRC04_006433 [Tulasnella sp. 424]